MSTGSSWDRVVALHALVEHSLSRALAPFGLGVSDYRALTRLAESPDGELRMQNLAADIGLNQSSVSRLVSRLERDGLTVRSLCADDRRGIYSVITELGRERQQAAHPAYTAALQRAHDTAADNPDFADLTGLISLS